MSSPPTSDPTALRSDRVAWWALLVGTYLRILPIASWPVTACTRDECGYLKLAAKLLRGDGIVPTATGWLWAPGYPTLLAAHQAIFGVPQAIRGFQVLSGFATIALLYHLGARVGGRGAARWAAWLGALSPTLVFYTAMLWSEAVYTPLLLGALLALAWSREGAVWRALVVGVLLGCCVLFRGVATYMLPVFGVGMLWNRWRQRGAWLSLGAMVLGAALTVGPYSARASARWGGTVISDRTLGQMMWLGNNDFPPMTFDYGNGALSDRDFATVAASGRPHCAFDGDPVAWDSCEIQAGVGWIKAHPTVFLQRVPVRLAQIMNPNSLLTRHLRAGKWRGLPSDGVEALCVLTVIWSAIAVLGGSLGMAARGRGALALTAAGVLAYHFAAIGMLAGLSRYRVPLDAVWLVWAGALLSAPREAWRELRASSARALGAAALVSVLIPLMLRFLPAGFP